MKHVYILVLYIRMDISILDIRMYDISSCFGWILIYCRFLKNMYDCLVCLLLNLFWRKKYSATWLKCQNKKCSILLLFCSVSCYGSLLKQRIPPTFASYDANYLWVRMVDSEPKHYLMQLMASNALDHCVVQNASKTGINRCVWLSSNSNYQDEKFRISVEHPHSCSLLQRGKYQSFQDPRRCYSRWSEA
jgi:hypothetical protein